MAWSTTSVESFVPTLKKVHADRKQALDPEAVKRNMGELVKTVFKKDTEIHLSLFPKDSTDVVDQAIRKVPAADAHQSVSPNPCTFDQTTAHLHRRGESRRSVGSKARPTTG